MYSLRSISKQVKLLTELSGNKNINVDVNSLCTSVTSIPLHCPTPGYNFVLPSGLTQRSLARTVIAKAL